MLLLPPHTPRPAAFTAHRPRAPIPQNKRTALQALAVEKQRQEAANRNKIAVKQKALADKKKEHKAKASKHKEVFGADYDEDDPDMDQYYDMEDVSRGFGRCSAACLPVPLFWGGLCRCVGDVRAHSSGRLPSAHTHTHATGVYVSGESEEKRRGLRSCTLLAVTDDL